MAEIIELHDRRPGGRDIVVAMDDALLAFIPEPRMLEVEGARVVYVAASTLRDPNSEADLWIGRYQPSAPGRRLFFQTISGAVYETDEHRRVWRNGELVWTHSLVDFGTPDSREHGILRVGARAALLFVSASGDGWHARVRLTTPVLLVAHLPALDGRSAAPRDWLTWATRRRSGA